MYLLAFKIFSVLDKQRFYKIKSIQMFVGLGLLEIMTWLGPYVTQKHSNVCWTGVVRNSSLHDSKASS